MWSVDTADVIRRGPPCRHRAGRSRRGRRPVADARQRRPGRDGPVGGLSLQARADGDYVTAEPAGAQPLDADRTAIGPWEEFELITG